jgi:hypothetical protein
VGFYTLKIVSEGESEPDETISLSRPSEVLDAIPTLLAGRPNCHRFTSISGKPASFRSIAPGPTWTTSSLRAHLASAAAPPLRLVLGQFAATSATGRGPPFAPGG